MSVAPCSSLVARGKAWLSNDGIRVGAASAPAAPYVNAPASLLRAAIGAEGYDAVDRCAAVARLNAHACARLYGATSLGRRLRGAGARLALEPALARALRGRPLRAVLAACEAPSGPARLERALALAEGG